MTTGCNPQATGKTAHAVIGGEIGGGNGIEALVVGLDMGLPVVDADFMGRAFPELQVCKYLKTNRRCTA